MNKEEQSRSGNHSVMLTTDSTNDMNLTDDSINVVRDGCWMLVLLICHFCHLSLFLNIKFTQERSCVDPF